MGIREALRPKGASHDKSPHLNSRWWRGLARSDLAEDISRGGNESGGPCRAASSSQARDFSVPVGRAEPCRYVRHEAGCAGPISLAAEADRVELSGDSGLRATPGNGEANAQGHAHSHAHAYD